MGRDAIRDLKLDFDKNHQIITPPKTQMTATLSAPPKTRRVVFPFTAIVGQEEMKLALLLNVIDPKIGGVMIMGDRGTGKSTTIRALADLLPEIDVVANDPFNSHPTDPDLMSDQVRSQVDNQMPVTVVQKKVTMFDTVEKFIPLEGVGHCPQDEAPELVNPILLEFIADISQRNR